MKKKERSLERMKFVKFYFFIQKEVLNSSVVQLHDLMIFTVSKLHLFG